MTNQPEKPDGSKPIPHQPDQPEQADPPKTEILPPAGDDAAPDWIDPEDLPPELQFDPIPTIKRWTGITPQKQRQFIAHLAATGAVGMAARAIGVSTSALYTRRQKPGAESFAAAWDRAVEMGARRVLDTLMEHAIHRTPETLLQGKEVVLERRKYNTRSMMWIVQQRFDLADVLTTQARRKAMQSMAVAVLNGRATEKLKVLKAGGIRFANEANFEANPDLTVDMLVVPLAKSIKGRAWLSDRSTQIAAVIGQSSAELKKKLASIVHGYAKSNDVEKQKWGSLMSRSWKLKESI